MARYRITARRPVTEKIVGVAFADGEAELNSDTQAAALAYFQRHGYGVEQLDDAGPVAAAAGAPAGPEQPPGPPEQPKKSASADVWRAYAVAQGMPSDQAEQMTRDELVATYTQEATQ